MQMCIILKTHTKGITMAHGGKILINVIMASTTTPAFRDISSNTSTVL